MNSRPTQPSLGYFLQATFFVVLCLLGLSFSLSSCQKDTQEIIDILPQEDTQKDIVYKEDLTVVSDVAIPEEDYENLSIGQKEAFNRYESNSIPEEELSLEARAIRAGLIGEYRVMNRICGQAGANCIKTFITITAPYTGSSTGTLIGPSEYKLSVLGFQTTSSKEGSYSSSSYENMPYRILATIPGYLTDIMSFYHQSAIDEQTTQIEFRPIFMEPVASWENPGTQIDLGHNDIVLSGTLPAGAESLYLYEYSRTDFLDLGQGLIFADSLVDGELQ